MNQEFEKLMEAVAELQGKANGNATMLEALLMAHPDPQRLRECWYRLSAPRIAAAATEQQTKARPVDEAYSYHLLAWQAKLDKHHPG